MKRFVLFLAAIFLAGSCEPPEKDSSNLKELQYFTVVDISKDSGWDYWVLGKEEYFYIDAENNLPVFVFFHSFTKRKDYVISFNDQGLPKKVTTDHLILLFDNFNNNKVDLGIISPDNKVQIIREVKTDFIWSNSSKSRADIIRWTSRVLGAIPCVTYGASALVAGGTIVPLDVLALWECGNYFLSMADNFFDDAHVQNGFTDMVSSYNFLRTNYTCPLDITSCLIGLANTGLDSYADYLEEIDQREELLRIVEASLSTGYGDIQTTSTWDNESDLDLHVIDPFDEEIYWNHPSSVSGGYLDVDDTDGYGPENIFWSKDSAPDGLYQVFLHDYFWDGKPESANYKVLINAFGKTWQFEGTINLGETVRIANFDKNGLIPLSKYTSITKITISPKR
jgi:hypothetical protein